MDKWSANAGRWNSGQFNSGRYNSGNGNSGNGNSGNRNAGDWNSGNRNAGLFNTKTQKICLFNKQTDLPIEEIREIKGVRVLSQNYKNNIWVPLQEMTEEEKQAHPEHKIIQGYLKMFSYKEAWRQTWNKLTEEEKQEVMKIPNFNAEIFKEITGIEVDI